MTTPVLEELRKRATAAEFILIETVVTEVHQNLQADKIRAQVREEIIAELRLAGEAALSSDRGLDLSPAEHMGRTLHRFLQANPKP